MKVIKNCNLTLACRYLLAHSATCKISTELSSSAADSIEGTTGVQLTYFSIYLKGTTSWKEQMKCSVGKITVLVTI